MPQEHPPNIRSTQRPPRSCGTCAKRRVRCDKKIPCNQCLARGSHLTCTRETVRVKGKIIQADEPPTPSYQDLLDENRRLKAEIEQYANALPLDHSTESYGEILNITESFERELFEAVGNTSRVSTVRSDGDVIWPSSGCVEKLLAYGRTWTSWIHCALHHPTFERECLRFMEGERREGELLWFAVYFSFLSAVLLFMDEKEAEAAGVPGTPDTIIANWYDSALYYLHKADFLRQHDMRSVQAIAILGIVFVNVGDSKMYNILWACAIRIAQSLNMGDDRLNKNESLLRQQIRRRLWWTLVLCDWIPVPYHPPCIIEGDFHVDLPAILDDDELQNLPREEDTSPRPIAYHIVMIQLAKIYHRFRRRLSVIPKNSAEISTLVIETDEALANSVAALPLHLQSDASDNESLRDAEKPWIAWQRMNISLTLLYYRIAVNRVLQNQWIHDPTTFARTRAICVGSARAIVSLASSQIESLARHRPWSTSLKLFSAAIILIVEARFHADEPRQHYEGDINFCVGFLDGVKSQSIIAEQAVRILRAQILDGDDELERKLE